MLDDNPSRNIAMDVDTSSDNSSGAAQITVAFTAEGAAEGTGLDSLM